MVTRVLDHALNDERTIVYVPGFPIADWIVRNWWSLLWEPCRSEALPSRGSEEPNFSWTKRHCLRAADSDLMLPALYFFDDGPHLRAEWPADPEGGWPNMPGEFSGSSDPGGIAVDRQAVAEEFRRFVSDILRRVDSSNDARVRSLREDLDAITSADADEQAWCRIVGRMGLDPYDADELPTGLSEFLAQVPLSEDRPSLRDLTAVASPALIGTQWRWVQHVARNHGISAGHPSLELFPAPLAHDHAANYGYSVARKVRGLAKVDPDAPIDSVEAVLQQATGVHMRLEAPNHFPGGGVRVRVRLLSGWRKDHVVLAGPALTSPPQSQRFAKGRGVFHALTASAKGERLVSDAFDWDQRASRAFAAELLAPQSALRKETGGIASSKLLSHLAQKFQVSEMVIARQLQNAEVTVLQDE